MTKTFLGIPGRFRKHPNALGADAHFPDTARNAINNSQLRGNLRHAMSTIRSRRQETVAEIPDWEGLREAAAALKTSTLENLDKHLLRLEREVILRGGNVHWARDALEAGDIITELVQSTGEKEVLKVKSMTTQEIGLNERLARSGIEAYETDLAELIVQLADDRPSHILVPSIHRNRGEIREIFRSRMKGAPPELSDDPAELVLAARTHMRERFLRSRVAITGANFAVSESGALVIVESEGNGRMCLTLPKTLIALVGIEKVVPKWQDLEVFMQLLPASATGERMNPYTSMFAGITPGDGPEEFHLVLLDNGRTKALGDEIGREALNCIKCSACINICPVYERAGGEAYASAYPGPIGAVLAPQLAPGEHSSLPFASTLCGACLEVCPVKIDIPSILIHLRTREIDRRRAASILPSPERLTMAAASWVASRPTWFSFAARSGSAVGALAKGGALAAALPLVGAWQTSRDLPPAPEETLRDWWVRTDGGRREGA